MPADVQTAINRMTKELDRLLQEEDLPVLIAIAHERCVNSYKAAAKLLRLRLVHEYENGERWADLHPVLREVRRVKEALTQDARAQEEKN